MPEIRAEKEQEPASTLSLYTPDMLSNTKSIPSTFSPFGGLPLELINKILEYLSEPPNPSSFQLSSEHRGTLRSCCLVSKAWKCRAQSSIFRYVSLDSIKKLSSFSFAAQQGLAKETRRLALLESVLENEDLLAPLPLLYTCKILESLDRDKFQALLIDRDFRSWHYREDYTNELSSRLLEAKSRLTSIEELICIQDEAFMPPGFRAYNNGWRQHTSLRRLSLYNNYIDNTFLRLIETSQISHVVCVRPDYDDCDIACSVPYLTIVGEDIPRWKALDKRGKAEIILSSSFHIDGAQAWLRDQGTRGHLFKLDT